MTLNLMSNNCTLKSEGLILNFSIDTYLSIKYARLVVDFLAGLC